MTQLRSTDTQKQLSLLSDAILARVADGDNDAFRTLYYSTQFAVYGYILSFMKKPEEAEDIMQDTYLRIREKAHLYTPCGKPLAWIFTIARNLCFMRLRSGQNHSLFSLEDAEASQTLPVYESNSEDKMVLAAALQLLDDVSRQVVILHAVTGLRHREIAAALGLPLSTVLSRYTRSLAKLKSTLKEGAFYEQ